MRILLTGNNGYIGTVMASRLLASGHEVVGLDTGFFEDCVLGTTPQAPQTIEKDLREVSLPDLQGFEAIIHLAALSNDPLGDLEPELTYDINLRSTVKLAELAREVGVERFLYASSCSIYGASDENDILNEEAPLRPITPYALSKVRAEEELRKLADDNFAPVFLRNATVYGFSPRLRADIVLNNLTAWAFTTGRIFIMSDGTPWRPMVHIEDISQAFELCLTAPRDVIHNQAVNVGSDLENYQVRTLAEIVRDIVPDSTVEYAGKAGPDPRNYRVDFTKLTKLLPDFKPQWNARLGVQQLYKAYQDFGLTREHFEGRKYIRLNQLKYLLENHCIDKELRWTCR